MRIAWLTLALLTLGCFGSHDGDRPDSGLVAPPIDGGGAVCLPLAASVNALRCSAPATEGGFAAIEIDTSPARCCASGAVASSVSSSGTMHRVDLAWTACDCCEGCRCVGPLQTVRASVGPLAAGTHTVESGGQRCTFEVVPAGECRAQDPAELRMPLHLLEGQAFSATFTSRDNLSCGCTPRVVAESDSLVFETCDCCDECDCIDSGYQSSAVLDPLPVGSHPLGIPHGERTIVVHALEECRPTDALGVEIVGPAEDAIVTGPRLWWAHVTSEEWLCCAPPAPAIRQNGVGPIFELDLMTCVLDDCACVPTTPTPIEAWYSLGELAPGDYEVHISSERVAFRVPAP
jgi:hypothetical protein